MTGPMVTPDRETLAKTECPDCGHSAFEHHVAGGCSVITYGIPEDGFEPREACDCDENADGALLASSAVTTAADAVRAWAEDEAVMYRMAVAQNDIVGPISDSLRACVVRQAREDVLALAAALGGDQ